MIMRMKSIQHHFSQQAKVAMQNFFEVNPIYPSNSESDRALYKEKKHTIRPLEFNYKVIPCLLR